MSTGHIETIKRMSDGFGARFVPTKEILALPARLRLADDGYCPTSFGLPGGPPRKLSREHPVMARDQFTFVYVEMGEMPAYVKLEDPEHG